MVPSPFTMQMWEQPPLSSVHGCLSADENWRSHPLLPTLVLMDHAGDGGSDKVDSYDNGRLTVLPQVQLVHGVDVAEVGHPGLDLGAALPGGLINALDHLLLLVNPVQVVSEHRQAHRLQDV